MTDRIIVKKSGTGFLGLLALLFIGLKLGGIINWSWWLVLAPLWIPFAICSSIIALVAVFVGIGYILVNRK